MGFGGIYLGDLSLGYNGKMTVVYNSFFHMGPRSFFNIIRQRLGFTNSPITVGGVTFAQGPCAATYPNVTITLSGVNLTLTPDQYIRTSDAACVLGFATWNRTAPDGLPWTLGWALLHNTYTQFNYGQRTFGFAYLG